MKSTIIILVMFAFICKGQKPSTGVVTKSNSEISNRQKKAIPTKPVYVFNSDLGKYAKGAVERSINTVNPFVFAGVQYKWVLHTPEVAAHFERINVKDKELLANKKTFTYSINPSAFQNYFQGYPYFKENGKQLSAPSKEFSISKVKENQNMLGLEQVKSDGLDGDIGKINVFYFKKLKLGALAIGKSTDYILVTDTLHLTQSAPFNNVMMGVSADKRPFIKIIANTILYESPLNTVLMGESDIVLCSNNVQFLSKFGNIDKAVLQKFPPIILYAGEADNKNHHYFNYPTTNDYLLLNRLNIKSMRNILDVEMNLAQNSWQKDKLVDKFQTLRKRTNGVALATDPSFQSQFAKACQEFDAKFATYRVEALRTTSGGLHVISTLNFDDLPIIKYYGLPSQAMVIPLQNDTTSLIGTIKFQAKGDAKLSTTIKVKLSNAPDFLNKNQTELNKYGIQLSNSIPQAILTIHKQPLKIMGRTMGEILPISNNQAYFEINLPEETKTLLEIFPKGSTINIPVDFTIIGSNQTVTRELTLILAKNLIKKLDYNNPLKSFDIFEKNSAIKEIKVQSNVAANLPNEGALDYVEIALEMTSGGKSTFKGPFSLSSYNTLSSNALVSFLAVGSDFTVTISGRAIYENGIREIVPFVTSSDIINIDETVFK